MAQPGYESCGCCGNVYKLDGSEADLIAEDHQKAESVKCDRCPWEATYFGPDPYEMCSDNDVALCEGCYDERLMDN